MTLSPFVETIPVPTKHSVNKKKNKENENWVGQNKKYSHNWGWRGRVKETLRPKLRRRRQLPIPKWRNSAASFAPFFGDLISQRWQIRKMRERIKTNLRSNQFHRVLGFVSGLWVTSAKATAPLVTNDRVLLGAERQYFSTLDRFKSNWVTNSYRPGSQSNLADTRVPKFTPTHN